jgi:hypothetical protein
MCAATPVTNAVSALQAAVTAVRRAVAPSHFVVRILDLLTMPDGQMNRVETSLWFLIPEIFSNCMRPLG